MLCAELHRMLRRVASHVAHYMVFVACCAVHVSAERDRANKELAKQMAAVGDKLILKTKPYPPSLSVKQTGHTPRDNPTSYLRNQV